ncbi:MAG: HDIG domain-containing protein [Thermodesulfobacteriota bacterium]|nr:HDIG domain-containing protein [Thermodesulfobacteriota bacterium]
MKIPDKDECYELIDKMEMMPHIIDHSIMVQKAASVMCSHLKPFCKEINVELVKSAALLHDITKTRSFTTKEEHAKTGGQLLTDLGFHEVGDIIRQHVILDSYSINESVTEAEIVNYADKRVLHDQIVPLLQRLEYILEKYGTNHHYVKRIKKMWENTELLERKLFKNLEITPALLPGLI